MPKLDTSSQAHSKVELVEHFLAKAFWLAERFDVNISYGGKTGVAKPVSFTGFRLRSKQK